MNKPVLYLLGVITLFLSSQVHGQDNQQLEQVFEQDQQVRYAAQQGASPPRVDDELERRIKVFEFLANRNVRTAEDYIRALVILQHTTLEHSDSGGLVSMSPENHLLAFQLARRAFELGHKKGAHFLVWTYNHYLQGVGCDPETYGFELVGGTAKARDKNLTAEQRYTKCGWFEPSDVYKELGLTAD